MYENRDLAVTLVNCEYGGSKPGIANGPIKIYESFVRDFENRIYSTNVVDAHRHDRANNKCQNNYAKNLAPLIDVMRDVSERVYTNINLDKFPFIISGDHSTSYGSIAGIKKAFPDKKIGVIWFDAHGDIHSPFTTPSGNVHGMPLALACGIDHRDYARNNVPESTFLEWTSAKELIEEKMLLEDLVFIGTRDLDPEEKKVLSQSGCLDLDANTVMNSSTESIVDQVVSHLADYDCIYISFDIDCLDPMYVSATGTPVKEGIGVSEASRILELLLKRLNICCFEITEYNPSLGESRSTLKNILKVVQGVLPHLSPIRS